MEKLERGGDPFVDQRGVLLVAEEFGVHSPHGMEIADSQADRIEFASYCFGHLACGRIEHERASGMSGLPTYDTPPPQKTIAFRVGSRQVLLSWISSSARILVR